MISADVYAAEATVVPGRRFRDIAAVQDYLDSLTASDWWSERFPGVTRIEAVPIRSSSVDAVGRPEMGRSAGVIGLTPRGRVELTVLHEVAHAVCPPAVGHGPLWVRTYLELAYRSMGTGTWSDLHRAFTEQCVDIG